MALPQHRADTSSSGPEAGVDWRMLYDIESPEAVESYVGRNSFLVPLLRRAPAAIGLHFGNHEGLRLEVSVDPDEGDEHLYLYVIAEGDYEEMLERRERLDNDWWIDAMRDARAQMTVDVEFP